MKRTTLKLLFLLGLPAVISLLYACATVPSMAAKHPTEVAAPAICSQCHIDGRTAMDHTPDFGLRHKFLAQQNSRTCEVCHQRSFCADCHAHKEELPASGKHQDAPERMMPHRGDYLNQHKIDGRINPASCFPCHGRQNNERCRVCHR